MITSEDGIISNLGLDTILNGKKKKPTKTLLSTLQNIDDKYKREIRNWVVSDKQIPNKYKQLDFEETRDKMQVFDVHQASAIFEEWIEQEILVVALIDTVGVLKDTLPLNQSTTLFGVEDRLPSSFEQKKWLTQVNVLDNPMYIIDVLNAGTLTGFEVEALQAIYPSILETMQEAIIEAIVDLKAKKIDNLGRKKLRLVNTLLQIPHLSPEKLKTLQEQYQPKEGTDIDIDGEAIQTDTQRIEHRK
jgi:hypothetical protein